MFKIRYKTVIQWLLLYLLFCLNGSVSFVSNQQMIMRFVVILFGFAIIYAGRYRKISILWYPIFLLLDIAIVRFLNGGGIGIDRWLLYASQIVIVYLTFFVDIDFCLDRFVKLVFIMACISIACYAISMVDPNILRNNLTAVQLGDNSRATYYGTLFYTFSHSDYLIRNTGIFQEPGRYQVVLSAALMLLLYFPEQIYLSEAKKKLYLFVFCFTIITTQSTTGYINLAFITLGLLFMKRSENKQKTIRYVVPFLLIGVLLITVNYIQAGDDSLLSKIVFQKLEATDMYDSASSGGARLRSIQVSIDMILRYPLGAGIDNINAYTESTALFSKNVAGGGLISYMGALGIPAILGFVGWLYTQLHKSKVDSMIIVVFILVYVNCGASQSYAFYPALLLIPCAIRYLYRVDERIL